jgi:hypothetical protein
MSRLTCSCARYQSLHASSTQAAQHTVHTQTSTIIGQISSWNASSYGNASSIASVLLGTYTSAFQMYNGTVATVTGRRLQQATLTPAQLAQLNTVFTSLATSIKESNDVLAAVLVTVSEPAPVFGSTAASCP